MEQQQRVSQECNACQLYGDYMCAGMDEYDPEECENLKIRGCGRQY